MMQPVKLWKKNAALSAVLLFVVIMPLMFFKTDGFKGADALAQKHIEDTSGPSKNPSFYIIPPMSAELQTLFFVIQAALGAFVLGFGFGRISAGKKAGQ